jgi:hypothetical protein
MEREQIIRMAQEAGFFVSLDCKVSGFEAFAALVASAERERLAKVFDELDKGIGFYDPHEPAEIIRGQA